MATHDYRVVGLNGLEHGRFPFKICRPFFLALVVRFLASLLLPAPRIWGGMTWAVSLTISLIFLPMERERDHLVSIETCISNSFSHGFSLGVPWVFQSFPQVPSLPPAASCFGSAAGQIEVAAWLAAGSIVFFEWKNAIRNGRKLR